MAIDILINDQTDELLIENGDFVMGDCDEQNLQDLIISQKGEYKATPLVGVGIVNFIKQRAPEGAIVSEVREQMRADKFEIENVELKNGELEAIGGRND